MKFDWDILLTRLCTYPSNYHQVLPPCPNDRVAIVEQQIGTMPQTLKEMFERFNGAEFFIAGLPLLTLFRISTVPSVPSLEWGENWYVDKLTPKWRAASSNRDRDWAIGMMNYGGLILFDEFRGVKEWDVGEGRWLLRDIHFFDWIEKVMSAGELMMTELDVQTRI